jgi:hypothetical protein
LFPESFSGCGKDAAGDNLGLVERPLVGRLLLGKEHFLHSVILSQRGDGQYDGKDCSDQGASLGEPFCLISSGSWGLGSFISPMDLILLALNTLGKIVIRLPEYIIRKFP